MTEFSLCLYDKYDKYLAAVRKVLVEGAYTSGMNL